MKYKILILLIISSSLLTCKLNGNERITTLFIQDVLNKEITLKEIINKHLCTGETEKREERIEILLQQLNFLRKQLIASSEKSPPTITNYENLPLKEQRLLIDESQKHNVYSVKSEGSPTFWVLVKNKKIASFSTMNKGDRLIFLEICN